MNLSKKNDYFLWWINSLFLIFYPTWVLVSDKNVRIENADILQK